MICVTHEMGFAKAVADRVVFMDAGQILAVAPPAEFFHSATNPRLRAFLSQVAHADVDTSALQSNHLQAVATGN